MPIPKQLDSLLSEEMDRKNFLKYSGGVILAIVGVTGLLRILLAGMRGDSGRITGSVHKEQTSGYGSSSYGS